MSDDRSAGGGAGARRRPGGLQALARAKDDRRRVSWVQGGVAAPPFDDGRFDRVLASLLLHHLPDADKLQSLREARRVLRARGRLHVADWGQPGASPRVPALARCGGWTAPRPRVCTPLAGSAS